MGRHRRVGIPTILLVCGGIYTPATVSAAVSEIPDLGEIRYRDPQRVREIWVGFDVAGAAVPRRWGLFDMRVWTVNVVPSWAIAVLPHLTVGGRHGLRWYDATNELTTVRTRFHEHQLEASIHPLQWAGRRGHDRLSLLYASNDVGASVVSGVRFYLGGVTDRALALAYGISHPVARRWRLDWQVALRHVWVLSSRQRQARAALRAIVEPKPRHQVYAEGIAYAIHRDARQRGTAVPRFGIAGQFRLGYRWMSRLGVGLDVQARFNTNFMSGQAPAYEVRPESLDTVFGELAVGFRSAF